MFFNCIDFSAFDLSILNNLVDVFLAKTYSYYKCEHESHQSEMANTSPVEDMVIKRIYHSNFYLFLHLGYKYSRIF